MPKLFALSILLLTTACATFFDGTKQHVKVEVIDTADNKPLEDIKCSVTDDMGVVHYVPENPKVIKLRKGQGPLLFECKRAGYVQKNLLPVKEHMSSYAFLSLIIPPILGIIIDAMTGALFEYPGSVTVQMEKVG